MDNKDRTRKIYGLAAALGIDRGDELHAMVLGLAGREHISELDDSQYRAVINELYARLKLSGLEPPPNPDKRRPPHDDSSSSKGMTKEQQSKVWYLMYQLKALDQRPRSATLGERLRGIIKRELHVDATAEQPFAWLNYHQGGLLIERLKQYVSSAASKAKGRDSG